jgi:hypothetical protein
LKIDATPIIVPADHIVPYYLTFGISDGITAEIYGKISPERPQSKPTYGYGPNSLIACKACEWYRVFNSRSTTWYIYHQDEMTQPFELLPDTCSPIYAHETDVYIRTNANYQQLALRELTDKESHELIPADVRQNVFRYTRIGRVNWIRAKDYIWTGTLTYVDSPSVEAAFTDEGSNIFHYNFDYVKLLLKSSVNGKITGQFIFKPVPTGQFIKYVPIPINLSNTTHNTDILINESGSESD